MKIGVIIVFHNNETELETALCINQIKTLEDTVLCLVDNASKDNTLSLLDDIKEVCSAKVSVIEIKKKGSEIAAIKAGARYMLNQFNLKYLGYIDANALKQQGFTFSDTIEHFCSHKDQIISLHIETLARQKVRKTLLKRVFSVVGYLKDIIKSSSYSTSA